MLSRSHRSPVVLACSLLFLLQFPALGQRLDDGEVTFNDKARSSRLLRVDLFKGRTQADPKDKTHLEAVDIACKDVTYPLIWRTMRNRPDPGKVNELVEEFDGRLVQMSRFKVNTIVLQRLYVRGVIDRVQEVMQHETAKPIATVNAARMLSRIAERRTSRDTPVSEKEWLEEALPRLAEGNAEHLATVCLGLLNDPKTNDGARYYLFRTLASLLGLPPQTPALVQPTTAEKICAVAMAQVEKKMAFFKATPTQEKEGYKMLRLQAVKVLSQARLPIVGKERVALTLARVAGNDESIEPEPRLEERTQAAIGLARMGASAAKFPNYQPDYAAAQICLAVVELGNQANGEGGLDSKPAMRRAPWKVEGARIGEALEAMRDAVKIPYVQQAADQCLRGVLLSLERGQAPNPNDVSDWLSRNEPASKSLFNNDNDAVVKPRPEIPPEVKEKEKAKEKEKEKVPEKEQPKTKDKPKTKGKGKEN